MALVQAAFIEFLLAWKKDISVCKRAHFLGPSDGATPLKWQSSILLWIMDELMLVILPTGGGVAALDENETRVEQ